MSDKIVGKKVWITRDFDYSDFEISERRPTWGGAVWRFHSQFMVASVCNEKEFRRWLGRQPTAKLKAGGPEAIEEATLYVAIDWGH
jgi:hypothetical protein